MEVQILKINRFFTFTPKPVDGAKNPPLLNTTCYGYDLSKISMEKLRQQKVTLSYLLNAFKLSKNKEKFFNNFFIKLSGTKKLETQIRKGLSENEIKSTWKNELNQFKN